MIVAEHEALEVPIKSLKHYHGNARVGNVEVIRESLRKNGQYRPLVVKRSTMEILAGNHTWDAAKEEGWSVVWANFIECDEETAARINLVDNRSAELGAYNHEQLVAQLGHLPSLEGTGYTTTDVDKLTAQLIMGKGGDTDPKCVPPEPQSKRGDLYVMGNHRLLCGDCTNENEVKRLMGDDQPVCMWTDPPYVGPRDNSADGERGAKLMVSHSVDDLRSLLTKSFGLADQYLINGAVLYVCHPGGPFSVLFGDCFVAQKWRVRQTLVWLKESMYIYGHDYHMQHELMLEGEKYEAELIAYGFAKTLPRHDDRWYGSRTQSSVLEHSRAKGERFHPTMKPIGLLEQLLLNSTPRGAIVYDPFVGSGTTIIAGENLGRSVLAMEIDPGYCDVIVDRWERHTGNNAVKTRTDSESS